MLNMADQEKENSIENTESLGSGTSKLPVAVDKALSLNGFVQSWYLTKMRYDFSLIEKNIFLKIVEKGQKFIKKEYLGKNCNVEIEMGFSGEEATVTFPISEIAGKSHNYQLIKENLVSLSEKRFGLPIDEGWDFSEMYLFSKIESSKQKGLMRVKLTNEFWKAFYNLKVFKVIDPNVAYKFRSVYTERIYELLVGNSTVITFELKHIRTMFCLENKYASNYDFINRVIKSSQKEMKELEDCPFYFEYELGYEGRTAKNISFRVIDKAKGIVAKPMSREWHDRHAVNMIEDEERQRFYRSIVADRKPYFMIYIYPSLMKEYRQYLRKSDGSALREFRMTVDEMKALPYSELSDRQKE